jgi:hypothetical protein
MGKDLDGETEKWKGRKLSARGSEQQPAGDTFAGNAADGPKYMGWFIEERVCNGLNKINTSE